MIKKIYTLPFFALLFLPFCGHRQIERPMKITKAEINLYVQSESLRVAVERRLSALEAQVYVPRKKVQPTLKLEAVRASDPVHQ